MKRVEAVFIDIDRGVRAASRIFNWIAMVSVVLMMTLTVADVVLRLFRSPITGTYEIVGLLGAIFVSFSLAWQAVLYASSLRGTGEVSLTLQVPLYPFVYGVAIGCGMLCIVLLFRFAGSLIRVWIRGSSN
jgi:hypothetical protein